MSNTSLNVFKQNGSHQFYCRWTAKEDKLLTKAVEDYGSHKWAVVAKFIPGRTAVQCSTRWFGALNSNVHKGKWSKAEDQVLTEAVQYFQTITTDSTSLPWKKISESISNRTGIQCQARWTEALDPAIRKGRWHPDEDKQLKSAIAKYGCCWIRVAGSIPTRTQRQCRTRWNQIQLQQKTASKSLLFNDNSEQRTIQNSHINYAVMSPTFPHDSPKAVQQETPGISPLTVDDIIFNHASNKTIEEPMLNQASCDWNSYQSPTCSTSSDSSASICTSSSIFQNSILYNEINNFLPIQKDSEDFWSNSDLELLLDGSLYHLPN